MPRIFLERSENPVLKELKIIWGKRFSTQFKRTKMCYGDLENEF